MAAVSPPTLLYTSSHILDFYFHASHPSSPFVPHRTSMSSNPLSEIATPPACLAGTYVQRVLQPTDTHHTFYAISIPFRNNQAYFPVNYNDYSSAETNFLILLRFLPHTTRHTDSVRVERSRRDTETAQEEWAGVSHAQCRDYCRYVYIYFSRFFSTLSGLYLSLLSLGRLFKCNYARVYAAFVLLHTVPCYIPTTTPLRNHNDLNESRLHLPEGPWDDVMRVIGQAHSMLHANGVVRIQSDIRVGSRTDKKQTAQDKVDAVNRLLGQDGA